MRTPSSSGRKATFGERLREARRAAGLTQRGLAERVGTSEGLIQKYERGAVGNPTSVRLMALADALDVHPGLLRGEAPEEVREGDPAVERFLQLEGANVTAEEANYLRRIRWRGFPVTVDAVRGLLMGYRAGQSRSR